MTPEKEAAYDNLLARLKAKDPNFDLMVELGTLCLKHINDLTPQERKRYDELKAILNPQQP
jgi:hypothetical protein